MDSTRDAVKREQDLAFEVAQRADREKEEVKRREAEERLEQAKLEEAVRRSEEEAKVREAGLLFRGTPMFSFGQI